MRKYKVKDLSEYNQWILKQLWYRKDFFWTIFSKNYFKIINWYDYPKNYHGTKSFVTSHSFTVHIDMYWLDFWMPNFWGMLKIPHSEIKWELYKMIENDIKIMKKQEIIW